ncbi:hypothetical protein TNCV_2298741 [Trichonephila clavipes]|nr:hypothetical protein TNCV_2298741 [Trichonephila clavipes]
MYSKEVILNIRQAEELMVGKRAGRSLDHPRGVLPQNWSGMEKKLTAILHDAQSCGQNNGRNLATLPRRISWTLIRHSIGCYK